MSTALRRLYRREARDVKVGKLAAAASACGAAVDVSDPAAVADMLTRFDNDAWRHLAHVAECHAPSTITRAAVLVALRTEGEK